MSSGRWRLAPLGLWCSWRAPTHERGTVARSGIRREPDGRNAAIWGLSSRALRDDPIASRFGGELAPGYKYATHPPLIIGETRTGGGNAGGEQRIVTRSRHGSVDRRVFLVCWLCSGVVCLQPRRCWGGGDVGLGDVLGVRHDARPPVSPRCRSHWRSCSRGSERGAADLADPGRRGARCPRRARGLAVLRIHGLATAARRPGPFAAQAWQATVGHPLRRVDRAQRDLCLDPLGSTVVHAADGQPSLRVRRSGPLATIHAQ